jgi:hypothetical protein
MDGNIYKGRNLRVLVAGKPILHATECSFSTTMNFEEIATKDTDGTIQTPGNYTWTLTSNHLVADKDQVTQANYTDAFELLEQYKNRLPVEVQFTTSMGGDVIISGQAYMSGANISAPVEGAASGDFNFQGNGNFEIERVPGGPIIGSQYKPSLTTNVNVLDSFSFNQYLVSGSPVATSWSFSGTFPEGVEFNTTTGTLTYAIELDEQVTVSGTITAINAFGSDSTTLNITFNVA